MIAIYDAYDKQVMGTSLTILHCDQRILHAPDECEYCASRPDLQKLREQLGISNSGHADRQHPCPADRAVAVGQRSDYNLWPGNAREVPDQNG